jgi:hypothetical protein
VLLSTTGKSMASLIDTSFLVAVGAVHDRYHDLAEAALREMRGKRLVPAPVLPELFYMLTERASYSIAISMFHRLQRGAFQIEALTAEDMANMREIMLQYRDSQFDFVDVSLMILAERLNITEIYTFDRRDFSIFQPSHCDYFELLP